MNVSRTTAKAEGRRTYKLGVLVLVAALAFATSYLLLPQFDPPYQSIGQQRSLLSPTLDDSDPSTGCASTRKVEGDGQHPPFIKINDLLSGAGEVSRQRRAPGCPPDDRLCRLDDVFDEIFVISLPRSTERLARVRNQLGAMGVPYTLVHALEGRFMAGAQNLAKLVMHNVHDQKPGVFALYLTQMGILEYVTRSPGIERVLILEDDVIFCADFPRAFDARIRRIPGDWRMLWLGALVWQATYQNAEDIDRFGEVGFARPTRVSCAFALGLHREGAAFVSQQMITTGEAIDQAAFVNGLVKWPNQTLIMWPPVALTNPYLGSALGHGWMEKPSVWAHDNGFDLTYFDLERGYHFGGELGSDLRCVIDEPAGDEGEVDSEEEEDEPVAPVVENAPVDFFVGKTEVVNSSAECCAKCAIDFPWCQAWRWYLHSHRCVITSDTKPRVRSAKIAVSGHMVQEDSEPRVPNVVHFFPPLHSTAAGRRNVWRYLAVLSAAINIEPDQIRWHYRHDGGGSLPKGPWWDQCVRPLVTSLHRLADDFPSTTTEQRDDGMRLGVLINEGGILLDTDALVVRSFDPLRARPLVSLGRDRFSRKLAGVSVVVAPRNASFLHRWWAKTRDKSLWDYRSGAIAFQLAEQHPDEVQLLPPTAFYPRSYSSRRVAYEADDCVKERESFSVHRLSTFARVPEEDESEEEELERVWMGKGSLHRVARAILRKALAGGRLCALAEKEVRWLEARGDAPTCPPA